MQDCGNNILVPHLLAQPVEAIFAPVIQLALILDALHLFGASCHNYPDCPDLVMTNLTGNACVFNPVLDCFGAISYTIGKLYQFPVQMRTVLIRIGGTDRPLDVGAYRGIVACSLFQMKYCEFCHYIYFLITFTIEILIENFYPTSFRGSLRGVQRGATSLAYWGVFSADLSEREENTLISYGVFKTSFWCSCDCKF